jgi:hypothetical protein
MPGLDRSSLPIQSPIEDDFVFVMQPIPGFSGMPGRPATPPPDKRGGFRRGLSIAFDQGKQALAGVQALAGETLGNERMRDAGLESYEKQGEAIAAQQKETDSFTAAWNSGSISDLIDWAQYGSGYVIGQAGMALGAAVAGGGAGGLAQMGSLLARTGITAGVKKLAKSRIEKKMKDGLSEEVALRSVFKELGAGAALAAYNTSQALGHIYPEAVEEAEKTGEDVSLLRVYSAGFLSAGVETLTDVLNLRGVSRALGGKDQGVGGTMRRMATEAFVSGGREAVTELAQTGIERWGASKEVFDPEALSEYIDAAALGFLGGGMVGSARGAMQRNPGQEEAPPAAPEAPVAPPPVAPPVPTSVLGSNIEVTPEMREKFSEQLQAMGIDPEGPAAETAIRSLEAVERATGVIRGRQAAEERAAREAEVREAFTNSASSGTGVGVGESGTLTPRSAVTPNPAERTVDVNDPAARVPLPPVTGTEPDALTGTAAVSGEDIVARQEGWQTMPALSLPATEADLPAVLRPADGSALPNSFTSLSAANAVVEALTGEFEGFDARVRRAQRAKDANGGVYYLVELKPQENFTWPPQRRPKEEDGADGADGAVTPTPTPAPVPTPSPAPVTTPVPATAQAAKPKPAPPAPEAPEARWTRMTSVEREAAVGAAFPDRLVNGQLNAAGMKLARTAWKDVGSAAKTRLAQQIAPVAPPAASRSTGQPEGLWRGTPYEARIQRWMDEFTTAGMPGNAKAVDIAMSKLQQQGRLDETQMKAREKAVAQTFAKRGVARPTNPAPAAAPVAASPTPAAPAPAAQSKNAPTQSSAGNQGGSPVQPPASGSASASSSAYAPGAAHRDFLSRAAAAGARHKLVDSLDRVAPGRRAEFERAIKIARELFGREVVLYEGMGSNGFVLSNDTKHIGLRFDSSRPALQVLGHELVHSIARKAPDAYRRMLQATRNLLKTDAEKNYVAKLRAVYAQNGQSLPSDLLTEEMIADVMAERFVEPEFWAEMKKRMEPGPFRRIVKTLMDVLDQMLGRYDRLNNQTRTDMNAEVTDLKLLRQLLAQEMADVSKQDAPPQAAPKRTRTPKIPVGQAVEITPDVLSDTDAPRRGVVAGSKVQNPTRSITRLLKNLTPSERRKITDRTAQQIIENISKLPSSNEMAAVAWAGRAKRGWYKESADAISAVFGPDGPRFAALLAALSPQTSVENNLLNALNTWKNWVAAGRPTDREAIIDVMAASVQGGGTRKSVLGAWINNSVASLTAEDPGALVISGPKVNSFFGNLVGRVQEVTNDAWMANYALVDQKLFSGGLNVQKTDPGKTPGYLAMSAQVREAAARLTKLTGEQWTPAEVQETIWSWAKTLYETAAAEGEQRSARDLVRERALTDELINSTPDFSSLFLQPQYASILENAGYEQQLEGIRSAAEAARRDVEEGSAARSQAAPFAEPDQQRFELAAARRLDQLRERRAADRAAGRAADDGVLADLDDRGDGSGRDQGRSLAPLPGAPTVQGASGPDARLVEVAERYAAANGITLRRQAEFVEVDPERAARIAQAYEAMPHAPQDPLVKAAYADLIRQTRAQYDALVAAGYSFTFFGSDSDPYAGNPWNAMRDMRQNQRMAVYGTYDGYGTEGVTGAAIENNPMLADTGLRWPDQQGVLRPVLANDLFRAVHDAFGHGLEGAGFRARGEENAWQAHARLFTGPAVGAITSETRGQNSWLNYGPYGETNRTASLEGTVFAEQKTGLMPEWTWTEGRVGDAPTAMFDADTVIDRPGWDQRTRDALNKPFNAPPKQPIAERLAGLRKDFLKRFTIAVADPFVALKDISSQLYMRARMTNGIDGGLEALIHFGQVFNNGGALDVKRGTKGLTEILMPLGQDLESFMRWVALNRAAELKKGDRENYFTEESIALRGKLAEGTLPNGRRRETVYREVLAEFNAMNQSVLALAREQGLLDAKGYDRFSKDIWYVPFYRVAEGDDDATTAFAASPGLSNQQFSEKLKGGTQRVDDLLANTLRNWGALLAASQKNAVARDTVDESLRLKGATRVPDGTAGAVKIMRDGKQESYLIEDPLVAAAMQSINMAALNNPALKVMGWFKRVLTGAVTIDPAFKVRNLIRDSLQAMAIADLPFNPIANVVRGMRASNDQNRISAIAGGGMFHGHMFGEDQMSDKIERLVKKGVDRKTILTDPVEVTKRMMEAYQKFGDRTENANRVAIYDSLIAKGKSHLEAAFEARDMMDFSLQGRSQAVRMLAMTLPFFNARLQGLYKIGRDGVAPTLAVIMGKANETEKAKAQRFSAVAGGVVLASLMLYLSFKDDEEFQKREDWDRDMFWWFRVGDTGFRIPKPFEVGAIGTIAERALEQLVDPNAGGDRFADRLYDMLVHTFAFDPVTQMFRPALNVASNTDTFTKRQIESMGMQRLSKSERWSVGTTETAKALSAANEAVAGALGPLGEGKVLSPLQIDYLARAYFGWLGGMVMQSTSAVMKIGSDNESPAGRIDQIPVLGGFVRDLPASQSRFVSEFYKSAQEIDQKWQDIQHYRRLGLMDQARELAGERQEVVRAQKLYAQATRQLSELSAQMRRVQLDKSLGAEEKRRLLDQLSQRRSDLAQRVESRRRELASS